MQDLLPITPFTQPVSAIAKVPGSKSITNRALLLAALNEGPVTLHNALFSEDVEMMLSALQALGITTQASPGDRTIRVEGRGGMIPNAKTDLYVGNAGTVARFLTAALALRWGGSYRLDGAEPMRKRPMVGLLEALESFGCTFQWEGSPYCFPFQVRTQGLRTGVWQVNAESSSQMLSALLLVASLAEGPVRIQQQGTTVSKPFVDMTCKMIAAFRRDGEEPDLAPDGYEFRPSPYRVASGSYLVEPDATAASYFLSLPISMGGQVTVEGFFEESALQGDLAYHKVLQEIGLGSHFESDGLRTVNLSEPLRGGDFDFNAISDTFLTLAALAPLLQEPTTIRGIAHTRKQETDRVSAMATELGKLGQEVEESEDALTIHPDKEALTQAARRGVEIETYEDHRVAMSFAILGCSDLRGDGETWLAIRNPGCCCKTFPGFFDELEYLRTSSLS
ncbi:MAG: 3-phosphoshikimate 1-carboxyvinyltransferase [Opitutales bacterium]